MVDFNKYKQEKQTRVINKREAILQELQEVNMAVLEAPLPEDESSTRFLQIKKEAELEKLKNTSAKLNDEAKSIREKWEKEGFDPFKE